MYDIHGLSCRTSPLKRLEDIRKLTCPPQGRERVHVRDREPAAEVRPVITFGFSVEAWKAMRERCFGRPGRCPRFASCGTL